MSEKGKIPGLFDSIKKVFSDKEKNEPPKVDAQDLVEETSHDEEKQTLTRTVDFSKEEEVSRVCLEGKSKEEELDIRFAENFVSQGGKFVYCESKERFFQLLDSLKEENKWNHIFSWTNSLLAQMERYNFQKHSIGSFLDNSDAAISYCEFCCADEGVIVLSPDQASNRKIVSFPPVHIIIATRENLIGNVPASITQFAKKHFGKLPALVELQEDKKVGKYYHKDVIDGGMTEETFVFYIDIPSFEG